MTTDTVFPKWFARVRKAPGIRFTSRAPKGREAYTWEHKPGDGKDRFYWLYVGKTRFYAVTFETADAGSLWVSPVPILANKDGPEREWTVCDKMKPIPNPLDLLLGGAS